MSFRLQRLNQVLKEELGKILFREIDLPSGVLLTITRVQTAADLETAKVFISVFPESSAVKIFKTLESRIYFLQQRLNKKLQMRPVPRLVFCQEKTTFEAGRIEELLEQVKQRPVEKRRKKR